MCLPKFTHIAAVIPSLSLKSIKVIEREFELFLKENNASVKNKTTRYMARKIYGLGMLKICQNVLAKKTHFLKSNLGKFT